tara:strand:+ start:2655 stop:2807 length:153 start_codon:yes stop_codon:yes gene_type:complete
MKKNNSNNPILEQDTNFALVTSAIKSKTLIAMILIFTIFFGCFVFFLLGN